MRLEYSVVVAVLTLTACASAAPDKETPIEFGTLNATLNGATFTGISGPGSIIARWDTAAGQMQIEGDKRSARRWPEIVRLKVKCGALPRPGIYAIGGSLSPVSAEAFLAPTRWQRIWPLRGNRRRAFISTDSMPPGSLVLVAVDSANALIEGYFTVSLISFDRTPAETLHVRGNFFGRLDLRQPFPGPRVQWAPGFRTDCDAIPKCGFDVNPCRRTNVAAARNFWMRLRHNGGDVLAAELKG